MSHTKYSREVPKGSYPRIIEQWGSRRLRAGVRPPDVREIGERATTEKIPPEVPTEVKTLRRQPKPKSYNQK
jgi:hypothetical protein